MLILVVLIEIWFNFLSNFNKKKFNYFFIVFIRVDGGMIVVRSWLVVIFCDIFIICFWYLWGGCLISFECSVLSGGVKVVSSFNDFVYFVIFILKY